MDFINDIIKDGLIIKLILSLVVIIFGVIIYVVVSNLIFNKFKNSNKDIFKSKRGNTYLKILKNISKYILILIIVLIIFHIFGINISSMLAGVGIVSIIIGFAIQDALKDIIKGIDIISDNYYRVGDVIKYEGITGKVINIGLKTTKIEDVYNKNVISISNRNIELVEVESDVININIPMPYEVSVIDSEKAINDIVKDINKIKDVNSCEYCGVNELASSSINYLIKVHTNPLFKVQIRRDALRIVLLDLDKHDISVPYNQIDVHQK